MGSIKTEEKQITKQRSGFFGTADGGAVGLINVRKAAVARLFLKTSSDFAERGRIDFLEGPAGSPELVERAEKMIGIARDRFCHQRGLFVVAHSSGEFFGGDGRSNRRCSRNASFSLTSRSKVSRNCGGDKNFTPTSELTAPR